MFETPSAMVAEITVQTSQIINIITDQALSYSDLYYQIYHESLPELIHIPQ